MSVVETAVGAGYQQSFQSIARIFAPTIFGFLYDHYDQRLTYWINAGTTVAWPLLLLRCLCTLLLILLICDFHK